MTIAPDKDRGELIAENLLWSLNRLEEYFDFEPCDQYGSTDVIDLDAEAAPDCYEYMGFVPCSCAGGRR